MFIFPHLSLMPNIRTSSAAGETVPTVAASALLMLTIGLRIVSAMLDWQNLLALCSEKLTNCNSQLPPEMARDLHQRHGCRIAPIQRRGTLAAKQRQFEQFMNQNAGTLL
jgi:hypothetical protein